MKPVPNDLLPAVVAHLSQVLATAQPTVSALYPALLCQMLRLLHAQSDGAVPQRLEDIQALSSLLGRAAQCCPPPLADRLGVALNTAQADVKDLRVSSLEGVIDGLNLALIDAQAWLDDAQGEGTEALREDVWALLRRINQRSAQSLKPW
jgi:hypothetical protein